MQKYKEIFRFPCTCSTKFHRIVITVLQHVIKTNFRRFRASSRAEMLNGIYINNNVAGVLLLKRSDFFIKGLLSGREIFITFEENTDFALFWPQDQGIGKRPQNLFEPVSKETGAEFLPVFI